MDLTPFSNENFDVKEWINQTLVSNNNNGGSAIEEEIALSAGLVTRLQLWSTELTNELESFVQQQLLTTKLPQATLEMHQMILTAQHLSKQVQELLLKVAKLAAPPTHLQQQLNYLRELHATKQRLELVLNTLVEAKALQQTLQHLDQEFSTKLQESEEQTELSPESMEQLIATISNISNKVSNCRKGYQTLEKYNVDRSALFKIQSFEQKLEQHIAPRVCALLISKSNSAALDQFVSALMQINKLQTVITKSYIPQLIAKKNLVSMTNPITSLQVLYEEIMTALSAEVPWLAMNCSKYFNAQELIGVPMVLAILQDYQPLISAQLSSSEIPQLIELFQLTVHFKGQATSLLAKQGSQAVENMAQVIMKPFSSYQERYPDLEKTYLIARISGFIPAIPPSTPSTTSISAAESISPIVDLLEVLSKSEQKMFAELQSSLNRCFTFTGGAKAHGLLAALNDVLVEYGSQLHQATLQCLRRYQHPALNVSSSLIQQALKLLLFSIDLLHRIQSFSAYCKDSVLKQASINSATTSLPSTPLPFLLFDKALSSLMDSLQKLSEQFVAYVLLKPVRDQLKIDVRASYVEDPRAESPYELPDFHAIPVLDYMTSISDHLVSLLHQLGAELHASEGDVSSVDSQTASIYEQLNAVQHKKAASYWLDLVCQRTLKGVLDKIVYTDSTEEPQTPVTATGTKTSSFPSAPLFSLEPLSRNGLKSSKFSPTGSRQLAADLAHLAEVLQIYKTLQEDTKELVVSPNRQEFFSLFEVLQGIVKLFKASNQQEFEKAVGQVKSYVPFTVIQTITLQKQFKPVALSK